MLKTASVCLVAAGIFLVVTADSGNPDSKNIHNEDDSFGIKFSGEPKERKFEDGETEIEKQKKEFLNEPLVNDTVVTDSTHIPLNEMFSTKDGEVLPEQRKIKTACGTPPEIEGAIAPVLEGSEHTVGTTISYQCSFGYVSRSSGGFLSTCEIQEETGEAQWTNPDVSCVSRSCGDPGYVPNARRIGNLFTFPNKVEFQCDEGYTLRGLKARYCQANGEWSGRLPTCELIYCSAPRNPENGRVRYSSLEYQAELRYECNKGFVLKNHQPRFCTSDGSWSNNEPECTEARCKMPDSPVHGSVQLIGEPKVGSLALYSCEDGTIMVGASTSKCLSTGDWTFEPPQCLKFCEITNIKDGEIGKYNVRRTVHRTTVKQFVKFRVGENVQHNESVILRCKSGFIPANRSRDFKGNSDEVLCKDGLWNKPMQCKPLSCLGPPPPIEHGTPVVDDPSHGKTIWYRCHKNFERVKKGGVTCEHGTWTGSTPVCGDTRCYTDQLNFPGLKIPLEKIYNKGTNFSINCDSGYKKTTRKKEIQCFNGKWYIDKNPCEIETCDDEPPPVMNGKPIKYTREHGSVVNYECDEHFDLIGLSTVQCQSGKWEGRPPTCEKPVKSVETTSSTSTRHPGFVAPESMNVTPLPLNVHTCSCTYDYPTDLIYATVGKRKLEPEDRVEKGETVSFICLYPSTYLLWPNGLRLSGEAKLTCDLCKEWQPHELPICEVQQAGDSLIAYNEKMKILPGGAVEIKMQEDIIIRCMSSWVQPKWHPGEIKGTYFTQDPYTTVIDTGFKSVYMHIDVTYYDKIERRYECYSLDRYKTYRATTLELRIAESEIQCSALSTSTNRGNFIIEYENDRKVNTEAYYVCKDKNQKLIGASSRRCLENGKWTGSFPSCEDITCLKFPTYNGLVVSYTNDDKVNSTAKFRCSRHNTLVGSNSSVCQQNGTWSNPKPTCENMLSCVRFELSPNLEVSYSDGVRVGSTASFSCSSPNTLRGTSYAICRYTTTWSNPPPTCEAPMCSIDTLMQSIPEGVVPDMSEVTDEFVPYGTELPLMCEDNLIHTGSSKAKCELRAKWEYGNVQCITGCRLSEDVSRQLIINPVKEYYRFGEFILLSCPPGQTLTSAVERVMCLSNSWSNDLPDCVEMKETSPPGPKETTRKFA